MASPTKPALQAAGLEHHLQVVVALSSQHERTMQALARHGDLKRLPAPEAELRVADVQDFARSTRQWALTALAMANLPEGVRHG